MCEAFLLFNICRLIKDTNILPKNNRNSKFRHLNEVCLRNILVSFTEMVLSANV